MISLYRSQSQMFGKFEAFLANLEKCISNLSSGQSNFVLLISDFHVKSRNWSNHDIGTTEGAQLDSLLTLFSMRQSVTEPKHILENASSCIGLFFTKQLNIVSDSRVHSSLYPKCHHQII